MRRDERKREGEREGGRGRGRGRGRGGWKNTRLNNPLESKRSGNNPVHNGTGCGGTLQSIADLA